MARKTKKQINHEKIVKSSILMVIAILFCAQFIDYFQMFKDINQIVRIFLGEIKIPLIIFLAITYSNYRKNTNFLKDKVFFYLFVILFMVIIIFSVYFYSLVYSSYYHDFTSNEQLIDVNALFFKLVNENRYFTGSGIIFNTLFSILYNNIPLGLTYFITATVILVMISLIYNDSNKNSKSKKIDFKKYFDNFIKSKKKEKEIIEEQKKVKPTLIKVENYLKSDIMIKSFKRNYSDNTGKKIDEEVSEYIQKNEVKKFANVLVSVYKKLQIPAKLTTINFNFATTTYEISIRNVFTNTISNFTYALNKYKFTYSYSATNQVLKITRQNRILPDLDMDYIFKSKQFILPSNDLKSVTINSRENQYINVDKEFYNNYINMFIKKHSNNIGHFIISENPYIWNHSKQLIPELSKDELKHFIRKIDLFIDHRLSLISEKNLNTIDEYNNIFGNDNEKFRLNDIYLFLNDIDYILETKSLALRVEKLLKYSHKLNLFLIVNSNNETISKLFDTKIIYAGNHLANYVSKDLKRKIIVVDLDHQKVSNTYIKKPDYSLLYLFDDLVISSKIKAPIIDFILSKNETTIQEIMEEFKLTRITAINVLNELVEQELLINEENKYIRNAISREN